MVRGRGGGRRPGDDSNVGPDRLGGAARARRTTAATDRNQDDVDVGLLLEDLERMGGDSCDEVWFVARVDVAVPMLGSQPFTVQPGVVEVVTDEHNLCSEIAHRLDLDRVGAFRSADDRGGPEEPRGKRN